LALGTEGYSPRVLRKAVRQAALAPSFPQARDDLHALAELSLSTSHLQRLSERIGREWADARDRDVAAYRAGQLPRDYEEPPAATTVAAVMIDGGRVQTRAEGQGPGVHDPAWKETKVACCLTLDSPPPAADPQPQPPSKFLDPVRVARLAAEMKARGRPATGRGDQPAAGVKKRRRRKQRRPRRIRKLVRTVVATTQDSAALGWLMAAEVHRRGLDRAARKACVCDGLKYNWTLFELHLEPSGFIGILDFLHLLVYLYAAAHAVAGKGQASAWRLYERWLRWAWSGAVPRLLAGLRAGAERVGTPPAGAAEDDPRQVVADAVTYVTNNRRRMDYPRYRSLGLPISSAPVESAIKQLNQRVKGSEKFWLLGGAEAILQVRAAYLSEDGRAERYWERPRPYARAVGGGRLRPTG
jgi:hypothetical protein